MLNWKFLHLLGVSLFVGNNLVTPCWKILADRTGEPKVIAFAQRLVGLTDWIFTLPGVVLIAASGYTMAAGIPEIWSQSWLLWGHGLFIASGVLWLSILLPLQFRMGRLGRGFSDGSPVPPEYHRLNRWWMGVGALASLLPIATLWWMVSKN